MSLNAALAAFTPPHDGSLGSLAVCPPPTARGGGGIIYFTHTLLNFFSSSSSGLGLPPSFHGLQQLHLQQPPQPGVPTQDQVPLPGEHGQNGVGHMSPPPFPQPPHPTHPAQQLRTPTPTPHRTAPSTSFLLHINTFFHE